VRQARGARQAIYPVGGRTHLSLGLPPCRPGIAVDTTGLNQVVDYPARDLTITVQAGIRVQDLQAILAKENQRLAVDIARPDVATLGGALATNASGPRRLGCGTLRDYLIGVSFVNDDGNEIKSGGRVVKNVAGYDMCKLLVGSLGTLGIITQATLKLRPLPEASAVVPVYAEMNRVDALLALVDATQTRPCSVDLVHENALSKLELGAESRCTLFVGFEDNEQTVAWQVKTLEEELQKNQFEFGQPVRGRDCNRIWSLLTGFERPSDREPMETFRLRASVPPQAVGKLVCFAERDQNSWEVLAHAGNGIVRFQTEIARGKETISEALREIRKFVADFGGHSIVEQCPTEWKKELDVWGPPRGDFWLMKRIKESLDPESIFNPGRFVAGI
jgi:glycolate oxidase FAD binding subunit